MGENEDLVRQLAEALKPFAKAKPRSTGYDPADGGSYVAETWNYVCLNDYDRAAEAYARAEAALSVEPMLTPEADNNCTFDYPANRPRNIYTRPADDDSV